MRHFWLRELAGRVFGISQRRKGTITRRKPTDRQPVLEALETRLVPSTFTVTNINDTGAGSLRNAVALANANTGVADTIVFDSTVFATPQAILLTSGAITFTDSAATTITGPGANLLTLNGNNAGSVFVVNSGKLAAMSGLTITGGNATNGGGIDNLGTVAVTNSTFTHNAATNGAGVFSSGTLTLTGCTFTTNTASNDGGGVYVSGTGTLINCSITGNTATSNKGGGVYTPSGTVSLTGVTLTSNFAGYQGGGFGKQNGTATLTNCTISGNTLNVGSASGGGGVMNRYGSTTLTNCTITGNNSAGGFKAGGVFNIVGTVTLTDCTVTGNTGQSPSNARAIFNQAGTLNIGNSIVAANQSEDINGVITSQGHNLIGNVGTTTGWLASDLTGTSGSLLNALLSPLGNYGGTTQTIALLPGSPAIGAGDNTGGPSTDARGYARATGSGGDIGAPSKARCTRSPPPTTASPGRCAPTSPPPTPPNQGPPSFSSRRV